MLGKGLLLKHLLNNSADILVFFDASLRIREISEAAQHIILNESQFEQQNLLDFIKICQIDRSFFTNLTNTKSAEKILLPTTVFYHQNKKHIVDWSLTVLPKQFFSEQLFLLKGVDTVKHQQVCEQYSELQDVFASFPGLIFWKDLHFIYRYVNENFLKLTGFSNLCDVVGKTDFDLPWRDQAVSFQQENGEILQSGKPKINLERTINVDDGSTLNFIFNESPLKDKEGNFVGILGVGIDITHLKQHEKFLQKTIDQEKFDNIDQAATLNEIIKEVMGLNVYADRSKIKQLLAFLKTIVANMPGNVYWKDINSVYMGGNNNVVGVCNLSSRTEIAGITDCILEKKLNWEPGTSERFRKDDIDVVTFKKPKTFEDHFVQADSKEVVMLTTKTPVLDDGAVVGILAVSMDITELKQQERALLKAKEQAEAANRAKTEFIANMSHDVKTPLAGIISVAELLGSYVPEEYKELTLDLMEAGQHLTAFFDNCIELAKLEGDKVTLLEENFSLKHVLNEIISLFQPSIKSKGLSFYLNYSELMPKRFFGSRDNLPDYT
jgi:two-component system aerobic respiration control sensor histidine kinase ArcB